MDVFISWSGPKSLAAAKALREWLPLMVNAAQPWLSDRDIAAGANWNQVMGNKLQNCNVGIFCLTAKNQGDPWINFEAGAIARQKDKGFVCTLLLDFEPSQLEWPLAQF